VHRSVNDPRPIEIGQLRAECLLTDFASSLTPDCSVDFLP
jgi:hypothetical protein